MINPLRMGIRDHDHGSFSPGPLGHFEVFRN
jgi:hypothetical protein